MTGRTMENGMLLPEREEARPDDALSRTIDDLDAALRLHVADFHRARAIERRVFHRFAILTALISAPALIILGVLLQQQFDVLPIPDATGGWRDWVWDRYGSQITDCVIRSRTAGEECPVSIDE